MLAMLVGSPRPSQKPLACKMHSLSESVQRGPKPNTRMNYADGGRAFQPRVCSSLAARSQWQISIRVVSIDRHHRSPQHGVYACTAVH